LGVILASNVAESEELCLNIALWLKWQDKNSKVKQFEIWQKMWGNLWLISEHFSCLRASKAYLTLN
jgi:hypothetical protein